MPKMSGIKTTGALCRVGFKALNDAVVLSVVEKLVLSPQGIKTVDSSLLNAASLRY